MIENISVIGTGYLGADPCGMHGRAGLRGARRRRRPGEDRFRSPAANFPSTSPACRELLRKHVDSGRLRFTTDLEEVGAFGDVHFIGVGTPQRAGEHRRGHDASSTPPSARLARSRHEGRADRRQVHRPGGHRRGAWPPWSRKTPPSGVRRDPRLEPRVPARGLRRRGHAAPRPPGHGHRRPRPPRPCCARSTPSALEPGRPADRHRLRDRRAGQGRRERVPGHQDLLHQRLRRGHRGRRRRHHAPWPTRSATTPASGASSSTPASASAAAACPRTSAPCRPAPASSAWTRRCASSHEVDQINLRRRGHGGARSPSRCSAADLAGKRIAVLGRRLQAALRRRARLPGPRRRRPAVQLDRRRRRGLRPGGNANAAKRFPRLDYVDSLTEAASPAPTWSLLTEWNEFKALDPGASSTRWWPTKQFIDGATCSAPRSGKAPGGASPSWGGSSTTPE